jgi:uncharacterized protein DUF4082
VGAADLQVSSLGRWVVAGNTGTHVVKVVDAATGTDLASATVTTAGATAGSFRYAPLSSPVTLRANTGYYLVTQETAGGDAWYDYDTRLVTAAAAADTGVVYSLASTPTSWAPGGSPGNGYGPASFLFTSAAGTSTTVPTSSTSVPTTSTTSTTVASTSTTSTAVPTTVAGGTAPFVTSFTPTNLRRDFSGWVGSRFTVGTADLQVSSLGRWVVAGNTGTHVVKVVDAATGTDLASVTVNIAGATAGSFRYVSLSSPVSLRANTTYYLVTQETAGGDAWYDYDTRLVTTTAAADTGVVYSLASTPTSWVPGGSPGNGYGPANFLFTSAAGTTTTGPSTSTTVPITSSTSTTLASASTSTTSALTTTTSTTPSTTTTSSTTTTTVAGGTTSFVTSFTPTNLRRDFSGWVGTRFTVGATDLLVSSLGRWVVAGNTGTHVVKVVDAATGTDLASVPVSTAGATPGTFRYASLAGPITLRANTSYYLVSQETSGGDSWYDYDTRLVTTAAAADTGVVYSFATSPTSWAPGGSPGNGYGPVSFLYR